MFRMTRLNPATGKPWDVLDMAALQPVAPLSHASGPTGLGMSIHDAPKQNKTQTDAILHQFDEQVP